MVIVLRNVDSQKVPADDIRDSRFYGDLERSKKSISEVTCNGTRLVESVRQASAREGANW